jgi:hypothetical protein
MTNVKIPINREYDGELVGIISQDTTGWQAQTVFGYPISRAHTQQEAEQIVREQGLSFLTGLWHYFDRDDQAWHPCILKEAYEHQVTVIRTSAMGYQDPDYKLVSIKNPTETNLVKS